jgi:endoglucanase
VDKPGIYKIVVQENGDSQWVAIGREQCDTAFKAAMKSYYFQRASIDLSSDFAGPWGRKAGHPDTSCAFHASTGKAGTLRSPGGWYDAGDYGKYVVNAGITVGTLLSLHELLPALAGDGSLKIPESGNGKNDLLDEVKYELDWLKTMQDADGGVFFKIGGLSWDGIILPAECQQPRYVIGKSTASTLNFAAVMAQAARVYRTYDKKYASDCGKRAEAAWRWALKHPRVMDPAETGGTGSYGDSHFEDEFFWAACELLVSTGNKSYRKFVEGALPDNSVTGAAEWSMVRNLGLYSLSGGKNKLPEHTVNAIRGSIVAMADSLTAHIDATPYRIPVQDFRWGSSGAIANHAVLLCLAHRLSGASKYIDGIVETMDYLFGKNATGYCFVTGFGTLSPMHPHHRIMASDVVDRPFPGFLVGGPNAERPDEIKEGVFYPDKEPAKSYVDDVDAYAANETCINWNAPLVFALGYLNAHWSAAGK